nr:MAG TPA: hypothetical protein [Caudoviricetes sp.]
MCVQGSGLTAGRWQNICYSRAYVKVVTDNEIPVRSEAEISSHVFEFDRFCICSGILLSKNCPGIKWQFVSG